MAQPGGTEGFYTLIALSPPAPTSFTVGGWTFNCTWHFGFWFVPGQPGIYLSACTQ